MLMKVVTAISKREQVYGKDQEINDYIDQLLQILHKYTGVREGWFLAIEDLLKGKTQAQRHVDPWHFDLSLWFAKKHLIQKVPHPSIPIILEIDLPELIKKIPIYLLPLSTRPPETIVPMTHLPISAISAVYLENDKLDQAANLGLPFPIKKVDSLAIETYLQDERGLHITPQIARDRGIDPKKPVCALRYDRNPTDVWSSHLLNQDIAPWAGRDTFDFFFDKGQTAQSLKKVILAVATKKGLMQEAHELFGPENAEKRIIGAVAHSLSFSLVRHLIQTRN